MRYSKLFGKTIKDAPKDEVAINARLLIRGGFIRREVSGVYNYLPLGIRVLNKISNIVREEMNSIGGQEVLLSSLQNKQSWEKTNRWNNFDALFKLTSVLDNEYALGPSHEEVVVPLAKQFISSYKDLPLSVYQIQTKFRDEKRAKSGILRGREFLMKDLYSFHATDADFKKYYEEVKKAYEKVFKRLNLKAIETQASGGAFSKVSHEYQVITDAGEDEIIYCPGGDFSSNAQISPVKEGKQCDLGHGPLKRAKAIEVGNIFPLGTKFSDAFDLSYKNKEGKNMPVIMGCYGIGISRLMGAIAEVHNDEKGIIWPESVAPYDVHLMVFAREEGVKLNTKINKLLAVAKEKNIEVLIDDRQDVQPGAKHFDADLIGIPHKIIISGNKVDDEVIDYKSRSDNGKWNPMPISEAIDKISKKFQPKADPPLAEKS